MKGTTTSTGAPGNEDLGNNERKVICQYERDSVSLVYSFYSNFNIRMVHVVKNLGGVLKFEFYTQASNTTSTRARSADVAPTTTTKKGGGGVWGVWGVWANSDVRTGTCASRPKKVGLHPGIPPSSNRSVLNLMSLIGELKSPPSLSRPPSSPPYYTQHCQS